MTDHLVLRHLELGDGPAFATWGLDRRFCEHAGWRLDRPLSGHEAHWHRLITVPSPDHLRLAAVAAGELVGYVDFAGASADADPDRRELGYVVGPSTRWGQGLGTAIARLALAYGFGQLGLQEIWAEALDANAASIRILQSIGMTEYARGADDTFLGVPTFYRQFRIRGT
ncbi:GNAT family protein [Kribbella sp. NPDC056861]|uniref:GNAT family N-acetyltransferase n=1 Tax=Kribbella sp. NPDC056861 TaxID=3154857 RepID=UPI003421BDAB